MCGLNILTGRRLEDVERMNDRLAHRGLRSRTEEYYSGYFTFGHVRLPIVGLDEQWDQPFSYRGWTFTFVGEIVNYKELSDFDCDVMFLADRWSDLGPDCTKTFDGFWAIAAVHYSSPWLCHIVTDFLGKKPVYVRKFQCGTIGVSSEIRGLDLPNYEKLEPDPIYFSSVRKWGYHIGNRTPFKGVMKLPPGSHTIINEKTGEVMTDPYHDSVFANPHVNLRVSIELSVARRVQSSDVPVSILLSGGLDSTIVYRLACRYRKDLSIFHVLNNEIEFASLACEGAQMKVTNPTKFTLDQVLRQNEGPVDLGSMRAQYSIGQAMKGHVHVCLSGDGADELFGGYRRALEYDSQGSDLMEEIPHYHALRLDKMMMAGTVELRSPFLGRDVVNGALALPYIERRGKRWLKKEFADIVPPKILSAEKRALKCREVLNDPISWRSQLIETYQRMILEGEAL